MKTDRLSWRRVALTGLGVTVFPLRGLAFAAKSCAWQCSQNSSLLPLSSAPFPGKTNNHQNSASLIIAESVLEFCSQSPEEREEIPGPWLCS